MLSEADAKATAHMAARSEPLASYPALFYVHPLMMIRRIISLLTIVALVASAATPLMARDHHCAGEAGVHKAALENARHEEGCEACEDHCEARSAHHECAGACDASDMEAPHESLGEASAVPAAYRTQWTICCCDHAVPPAPERVAAAGIPASHIKFLAKQAITIPPGLAALLLSFGMHSGYKIGASPPFLATNSPPIYLRLGIFLI